MRKEISSRSYCLAGEQEQKVAKKVVYGKRKPAKRQDSSEAKTAEEEQQEAAAAEAAEELKRKQVCHAHLLNTSVFLHVFRVTLLSRMV